MFPDSRVLTSMQLLQVLMLLNTWKVIPNTVSGKRGCSILCMILLHFIYTHTYICMFTLHTLAIIYPQMLIWVISQAVYLCNFNYLFAYLCFLK